ncbi:hypothetical protein TSUD_18770 [Trifolium subterraneum]|uniref:BED-type domain-containing protein n=1 Tax=Trifolium subterraneum TaxID=3900 RepID=A0A2Z6NL19_TRISU|nr:hypothetical protein TSUD_18770 [Trifolium subterraneum]
MASSTTTTLYVKNKGGFLTAYIIDQPYGEMNPKFIQEIYHELKEEIVVFDREYRCLNVQFNGSVEHPLIVYGWSTMRDYYRIDGNIMLLMTYVGDNHFLLDFLPQEFDPNKLPSYHIYKHFAADPVSFNVTLTPYLASASQLSLNKDFATYIRNYGFQNVILYGPQGDELNCKLLLRTCGKKDYMTSSSETPSSQPPSQEASSAQSLVERNVRRKTDITWAHWKLLPNNKISCLYCNKIIGGGGIHRVKEHLAGIPGNTEICKDVPPEWVVDVKKQIEEYRSYWKDTGCTLMADGWTDRCRRTLINFLVYCPKGTVFIKSVDASQHSKTADMLFKLFKEVVLYVGPENVVQFVTDNAANYVAAGRLLENEFPKLYWSPCAAHYINLMLQDMGKLEEATHGWKRNTSSCSNSVCH